MGSKGELHDVYTESINMDSMKFKVSESISLRKIKIKDSFWTDKIDLVRNVVIPYQWEVLNDRVNDAAPSHAIKNLKIAAGLIEGEFYGFFFQDTDLAKWLEAVAYTLSTHPDAQLEKLADDAIELVGLAQQEDGYLNSYFTTKAKGKRWTNLEECHELYTAGHFIEAGVAYYEATGKKQLLQIVCKLADYIDTVFGEEPEKLHGYDGHQEIELALIRLYEVTKNEKYAKLGKYFIDERGRDPYYFTGEWEKRDCISAWSNQKIDSPENRRKYLQAHLPVRLQKEATGHAVRVVYMLTGMADVARVYGEKELYKACKTLWDNIVSKQMYITGGIGSTHAGEAFTFDYDLPNDMVYAETCASIGLIVFAQRMLQMELNSCYADVIERALFNIIIGSMSDDGKHYFYVNPLEVWPEACEKNPDKHHVKPVRQAWFGCACCPPNLARLLSSLGKYIYTYNEETLFVHQFISSEVETTFDDQLVRLKQESNYPWEGNIHFTVEMEEKVAKMFTIAIRIPNWCRKASLMIDGEEILLNDTIKNGYARITYEWKNGSQILLNLDMPIEMMKANPKVRANAGKVAIQRGPVVYCLEEVDNGENLSALRIRGDGKFKLIDDTDLFGGAKSILLEGEREVDETWGDALYQSVGCDNVVTDDVVSMGVVTCKGSPGNEGDGVACNDVPGNESDNVACGDVAHGSVAYDGDVCEEDRYDGIVGSDIVWCNKEPLQNLNSFAGENKNIREKVQIKAIPYFMWGNRNPGEMQVWIRYND